MNTLHGNQAPSAHIVAANRTHDKNRRSWWTVAGTLGAAALVACSSSATHAGRPSHNTAPASQRGIKITFDSRPGRNPGSLFSNTIDVYPGVRDTFADKQRVGEFRNGDTDYAYCQTIGRQVQTISARKYGEQPLIMSNVWLQVEGLNPSDVWYATTVYMTNASQNAAEKLPYCQHAV